MRTLLLTTLLLSISLSLSAQNCDSIFVEYFLLLYKERENAILLNITEKCLPLCGCLRPMTEASSINKKKRGSSHDGHAKIKNKEILEMIIN